MIFSFGGVKMKILNFCGFVCLVILFLFSSSAWSENIFYSDANYSIKIAVTINENDKIIGKLEYSNHTPQYPLQLVAFGSSLGIIHVEPYVFELLEKTIISKNVHKIRCRPLNDKYGSTEITGTIDFSNELRPKVKLLNENGITYISNLTEKGKKTHKKYIPNVWLGH
jgi:hypothetical protein